jgi:hypothetical protein
MAKSEPAATGWLIARVAVRAVSRRSGRSPRIQTPWGNLILSSDVSRTRTKRTQSNGLIESKAPSGETDTSSLATGGCSMLRKLALSLALASCAGMPLWDVAEASIADSAFTPGQGRESHDGFRIRPIIPISDSISSRFSEASSSSPNSVRTILRPCPMSWRCWRTTWTARSAARAMTSR